MDQFIHTFMLWYTVAVFLVLPPWVVIAVKWPPPSWSELWRNRTNNRLTRLFAERDGAAANEPSKTAG